MFLVAAVLIICLAHIIRVFRWELLIETYEKPNGTRLMRSLSLGYFISYFIPFKLGDIGRAAYAGTKMKNGRGFALATVIVERCIDILTVGAIFLIMAIYGITGNNNGAASISIIGGADGPTSIFIAGKIGGNVVSGGNIGPVFLSSTVGYYIGLAVLVTAVLLVILLLKKYIKKLIYKFSGLLNEKYEEKVLRFFWALIWGFKDILHRLPKLKLIMYTVIMWGLYLSSYWAFATYLELYGINRSFYDVFVSLFDQKSLLSSGIVNGFGLDAEALIYAIYMMIPLAILVAIAIIWDKMFCGGRVPEASETEGKAANKKLYENEHAGAAKAERLNLLPQANVDERRAFLKMYFAGEKKEYIDNYLKINRNILVLRDYSAGSNATTILCTDGNESFYRKYAFQAAADKLNDQIAWMKEHEKILPLAKVIRSDCNEVACYYDMPYSVDAMTMFDYAHAGNKERAWNVLEGVLCTLEGTLYKTTKDDKKDGLLDEYIDNKIIKNLDKILENKALKELLKYKTVVINGKEYDNLTEYKDILTKENFRKVFENDVVSDIHGDLTIENIVCVNNNTKENMGSVENSTHHAVDDCDFYLIDPNTGNIFNSKFIDYAKLLQSLHGSYELLMAVSDVSVEGNHIDFRFVKSEAYNYLYDKYREYLNANFSKDEVRSIYYHEIANWLRLMPYKLEKGRGELFYAGLLMVLSDVSKME